MSRAPEPGSLAPMFRTAGARDAGELAALVNAAFSGVGGWTNEARLFRGQRTDAAEIAAIIAAEGTEFLAFPGEGEILACAYVKRLTAESAFLGLLAVSPSMQCAGLGKLVLAEAERRAREWGCTRMVLATQTAHRPELASFYERRGYARTGDFRPLMRKRARETAKVEGLMAEWLTKPL